MKKNTKNLLFLFAILLTLTACASPQIAPAENAAPSAAAEDVAHPASTELAEREAANSENPPQAPPLPTETQMPLATSTAVPTFETITAPALTQFDMIDAKNGWGQAEGMILRTEDGGESWLNITPENAFSDPAYASSVFLDSQIGWILLVSDSDYSQSVLYQTTDGGANWTWHNMPFGGAEIGFIDAQNGYVLENLGAGAGSNGVAIWTTQNGGKDYSRVFMHEPGYDASLPLGGMKSGISFINLQNGWVTGSKPQDGFVWLYRSQDGGFTWAHQDLALPPLYENAQTRVYAPTFFDNQQGTLPIDLYAEESATVFYRTTDGGENWQATSTIQKRGKYSLISPTEIILWDGGETLFFTIDGARTWESIQPNQLLEDELRSLDFINILQGWALAESGLYHTEDGGMTWKKQDEI